MSTFGSLYTIRSGLHAARRGLDVVGQNVAQANTVGYSRQEISNVAAQPSHVIQSAGRGVSEVNVLRYRDQFLDRQYRHRVGAQGYHEASSQALAQIEQITGTLTEGGLRTAIDQFFSSWQNLSLYPSSSAARVQVLGAASEVLSLAQQTAAELTNLRADMDEALRHKVAQINTATVQIAELNHSIASGDPNQQRANELFDRRDLLVDSLSQLAGVTTAQQDDGTLTVYLGSLPLVDRHYAYTIDGQMALEADRDPDPTLTSLQQMLSDFTWNGSSTATPFRSGEIAGLIEMRDITIPTVLKQLDTLVRTLAVAVNDAHRDGVAPGDAIDFFTVADPASWFAIEINQALVDDPNLILAAGTLPASAGDGQRAMLIAGLRDQTIWTGSPVGARQVTPGEFLRSISLEIGLQVGQAQRRTEAAALQTAQAEQHRQAVAGVSLDDEMIKMIQFQQAYGASARVMTAIDEMLEIVVNRIGLVGR